MFPVGVGLCQGCPLLLILFMIIHGQDPKMQLGKESVQFRDLRVASLLFADDVVLLTSSDRDLQHTLGQFAHG